jgi:phosphate transport system protein
MREVFQQELREVQDRLVEISGLVAVSIENATRAFNESDVALAETVIEDDTKIDALALALDELAIQILARQQPVARDLRIVVSALRISASLERMGDMAEHIAQLARYRFPEKVVPKSLRPTFVEMGRLDVEIARKLTELLPMCSSTDPNSPGLDNTNSDGRIPMPPEPPPAAASPTRSSRTSRRSRTSRTGC